MAAMLTPRLARTRRARDPGSRASAPSRCSVPRTRSRRAGPGFRPVDSVAGLGRLRRRHVPWLPGAGKQLSRRGAHRVGPHAQLLQDRRRDALLEQPGQQVMRACLGRPVRGGFPARRLQAGQQPVHRLQPTLGLQASCGWRRRLLREPLPRGLLRHPHPLADLGPRAPGVTCLGDKTADQRVAAGRQFLADGDRGLDPVQRGIRRPRPDRRHQRSVVQDLHTDNLRLPPPIVNLKLSDAARGGPLTQAVAGHL